MNKKQLIELNNRLEDIQLSISKTQKFIGGILKDNQETTRKVGGYMKKRPLKVTDIKTEKVLVFDSLRKASKFLHLGENGSKLSHMLKKYNKVTVDNYVVEPYNEREEVELP